MTPCQKILFIAGIIFAGLIVAGLWVAWTQHRVGKEIDEERNM